MRQNLIGTIREKVTHPLHFTVQPITPSDQG